VTNRLEILQNMAADRANAFANYGLAMEYVNTGALESAVEQFAVLLEHHPNYGAGYFHAGQTLEKLGRLDEARAMYSQGIAVTAASGDQHTRSELQASLDALG
jgi:tetratricopeptide (TPR) repeat protein